MIQEDKYWNSSNTPIDELDKVNINVVNTKYIIPEFTVDIADNYIITRCVFALIDYFYSILGQVKIQV